MKLSLLAVAAKVPEKVALVVDSRPYTYAGLVPRVQVIIDWLRQQGIRGHRAYGGAGVHEGRVAVVGENRLETLLLLYALMEEGVPAVLLHPRLTAPERRRLIQDARPALVIDESWQPPAPTSDPCLSRKTAGTPHEDSCLAILYTSGTTGRPKGAVLSRAAFLASAAASAINLGWQQDDRWLLSLPVAHVGGLSILTRCLAAQACVVVETLRRFDPASVVDVVQRQRVTLLSVVPTTLERLLNLEPPWQPPPYLRAVLLGGSAVPHRLLAEAADRRWPVLTTYGLTEACSQVTTQRYGTSNRGEAGSGEPLAGMEVRIRDGRVEIRGPALMDGYFPPHDPARAFSEDGWFTTGDLGYLDGEGRLHLRGRRLDLITSGGENVYPAEVEEVLGQHPAVVEVCVFGVDDEVWGQIVAAALVAGPGGAPRDEEIAAFCRLRLAPYKRPRKIAYLERLAATASGKVDRKTVRVEALELLRDLRKETSSAGEGAEPGPG